MNSEQLATRTGLTYRQIDYWVRQGYLRPTGGEGCGYPRDFPADEVRVAVVMARLAAAGMKPADAERVARGGDLGPGLTVLVDGQPIGGPVADQREIDRMVVLLRMHIRRGPRARRLAAVRAARKAVHR